MDNTVKQGIEEIPPVPFMHTPVACVLSALGFCCLATWWNFIVFAPVTPLLSFAPTETGIWCLLLAHASFAVGLIFCIRKADLIFDHLKNLVIPLTLILIAPAFAIAFLSWAQVLTVGEPLLFAGWIIYGLAEMILSIAWVVLFSLMPARWIALCIAVGGAFSPLLVVLLLSVEYRLLGLVGILFVIIASCTIAFYMLKRTGTATLEAMRGYDHKSGIRIKPAASVVMYGFAYGFIVILLCSLGLPSVIFACALALVGSLIAIIWAYRRIKTRWNLSTVQSMTMPVIVAVLLAVPFLGTNGQTICCGIALTAFAYTKLMEWTELVVKNAEFQLFPVRRYASGQLTFWSGLLAGVFAAFYALFLSPFSSSQFMILCCVIVVAVVTVRSLNTSSISESEQRESSLIIPPSIIEEGEAHLAYREGSFTPFRNRCKVVCDTYALTQREGEVLICLAKGRNAGHIQEALFISPNTVRTHIRHIYEKVGVSSQQELIDLIDRRA